MTPVAIDLEWPTDTGELVPPLVSLSWAGADGCGIVCVADGPERLTTIARDAFARGVVFANAPGDVFGLLRHSGGTLLPDVIDAYRGGRVFDVITREKMIDIAEGMHRRRGQYDLGSIALRRAGYDVDKNDPWRMNYGLLRATPLVQWPPAAVRYAMVDSAATFATWLGQELFRGQHQLDVFADAMTQARAHLTLYAQQIRGVNTDHRAVVELARDIDAELDRLRVVLLRAGLARIGGTKAAPRITRNTKAAEAMMIATGRAKRTEPTPRNPQGKVSLSEDAITHALLPDDHPMRAYQQLGTLSTCRTKNIPPLLYPVIRTRFDECVVTGRVSSSSPDDDDGTNLQNYPRPPLEPGKSRMRDLMGRFRGCLVPPPGYVFGIADFEGAELSTFADTECAWFGDSKMGDAIRAGRNAHTLFACTLLGGLSYDSYDKQNPTHKSKRQVAKKWNFGRLGGMGDTKFQKILHHDEGILMPLDEIKRTQGLWLETWGNKRYFDHVSSLAGPDRRITIVAPRTGFIRGGCSYTEACNFPFQSTAASAAKLALWWLWCAGHDPASPLFGCWQCLFVHDENVSCFPIDRAEAALAEQGRIMVAAFAAVCPAVPVKVESQLAERYGK